MKKNHDIEETNQPESRTFNYNFSFKNKVFIISIGATEKSKQHATVCLLQFTIEFVS